MSNNEEIEENIEEPLIKPKKQRSQKQLEAFEKNKRKEEQILKRKSNKNYLIQQN
eukprot:CAMPEP_0174824094 /NCGR_PEP_ID=MMETSP1107-20130205/30522_1 /TAXON_ID=36770 /ORGANISM="Paraphysomonas vestita, Strain GFlagA" /LENGTH=54 /DNA_ID=CAMNT_0016049487 /DNA_START=44 /DNA_END=208 /DNA_ORIENTATION=-